MTGLEPNFIVGGQTGSVPDSVKTPCSKCGRDVFIAPSGQKFWAENPDFEVICAACIPAEQGEIVPLSQAQMQELLDHGISMEQIRTVADALGVEIPAREE